VTQAAPGLLLGALAGLALGSAFYVGLWATLRRASRARRPWAWIVSSFLLRLVVVGAGFLLLARHGAWVLAGALAAFIAARPLVTYALLGREKRAE
jgi:F1F0 ATPase subunit 2